MRANKDTNSGPEVLIAVLKKQLFLLVAASPFALWLQGSWALLSLLFGGAMALLNTALMARRLINAGREQDQGHDGAMQLYFGAVERFIFTGLGFALGMGVLKLAPVPLLVGFALAQLVYFGASASMNAATSANMEEQTP